MGGWCCRGQVDTAAASCSSSRIQTWTRPGGRDAAQHAGTHTAAAKQNSPVPSSNSCRTQWTASSVLGERCCGGPAGRLVGRDTTNAGLDGIR